MNGPSRIQLANEAAQSYLELADAIRLTTLPGWITADLTISQVKAVFLLAYHGALAVSELAGLLGIGNPAASILVQQLVEQELVERSEDIQDRRRTLVSLTARGTKLISGRREQIEARLLPWLSQLSDDELTDLLRGLRALVEIVRSERSPSSATSFHPPSAVSTRA
jgi:DNA-binding MarR family transcriptional regulator